MFWYYYCNRSGKYRSTTTGKRMTKLQGSSKLDEYCTAYMRVSQSQSCHANVLVEYCSTHCNHTPSEDIGHLRMPEELRMRIAAKLHQGVSITKILDDIRDTVTINGLQREHVTNRKDIINIKQTFNIEGIQKHPNDQSSVCAWVKEMQSMEFDPVLVFKQQGVPSSEDGVNQDDFMLAIQTKYQLDMLKAYGGNGCVC